MKLIIAGSRDFNDYELLKKETDAFIGNEKPEIVSGTARGADKLGEQYAKEKGFKLKLMPADWNKFGKSAGYRRNEQMAAYADSCIVFTLGTKGSQHMIDVATAKGLKLKVVKA
jgi:hypothetical protein